jgi:hypothetical protein
MSRVLAHFEVIQGWHKWSYQGPDPGCPAGAWDEALVATNLWRYALPVPYGAP